jgi:transposase
MASPVLPEDLWKRLEPWIPKPKENRHVQYAGRKATEPRRVLAGILFVLRTGIPWRWLPATSDFPCGQTCRRHLRHWAESRHLASCLRNAACRTPGKAQDRLVSRAGGQRLGADTLRRRENRPKSHGSAQIGEQAPYDHRCQRHSASRYSNRSEPSRCYPVTSPARRSRTLKGSGAPRFRPKHLQGDRAYDSEAHRKALKKRG